MKPHSQFKDIMNSIGMKIDEKISVITIDGPSASGKGSLAKNIANHFDYNTFR